jgi:PRTRC genetic system protein C
MSDTNTPDTTSPTPPSRIFKYNDQTFADPGPAYTPDQIRSHLAAYFPELGQATIAEKQREDGVVEITFHKQITTKGGGDATAETRRIDILTAELGRLPVRVDPLAAVWTDLGEPPLTYRRLLAVYDSLSPAADANDDEQEAREGVIARCCRLPPSPLPAVPLGY